MSHARRPATGLDWLWHSLRSPSVPRRHTTSRFRRTLGVEGLEGRRVLSAAPLAADVPALAPVSEPAALMAVKPLLDLNGDTIVDAVWRDGTTGLNVGWIYDSMGAVSSTRILGGDTNWTIETVGDFNGDAVSDIAWRTAAGTVVLRLMNADNSVLSAAVLGGDTSWRIENTGDYNGDTKDDLIWRDATNGINVMWLMSGTIVNAAQPVGGTLEWRMERTGADYDSNGDGKTDVLWRKTGGASVLWRMDGFSVLSSTILPSELSATVAGTGDFNGDGRHDLLWRKTDGSVDGWLMDDGVVILRAFVGGNGTWSVNNTADVNSDGRTDILWRDSTSGSTVVRIMNAFTVLESVVLGGDATWSLIRRPDHV